MKKLVFGLLIISLLAFTGEKLMKVKLNDEVTIYVPKSFSPMTKEDMELRYQSYRLPLALYSDPSRLIDFGVNRSYSRWQESDLEMMAEFYKASIAELYDKVTILSEGIKEVNGHRFVFFEFTSIVYPENEYQDSVKKYTYIMYSLTNGTTYVFDFSCPRSMQDEWRPTAQQMMEAIKLK